MAKNSNARSSDNVFAKIVASIVKDQIGALRGELKASFEQLTKDILSAVDKKNRDILSSVDQKNDNLRSDVATMKDEIVGEIKNMREGYEIMKGRHGQILDHENRIEKLENIHPQGRHVTV